MANCESKKRLTGVFEALYFVLYDFGIEISDKRFAFYLPGTIKMLLAEKYPPSGRISPYNSGLDFMRPSTDVVSHIDGEAYNGSLVQDSRGDYCLFIMVSANRKTNPTTERAYYVSMAIPPKTKGGAYEIFTLDQQDIVPLEIAPRAFTHNGILADALGPLTPTETRDFIEAFLRKDATALVNLRHSLAKYADSHGGPFPWDLTKRLRPFLVRNASPTSGEIAPR